MEAQGHRAFSGTCDRLKSAGEQLKSGPASHLVVRENNCEWAIIGVSSTVTQHALPRKPCQH
ncbi:hypothetical protein BKA60DRAFT_585619 [Fusarium oxysporum]|nr:hypothetical protein BKA60DRAFT_585619 [Fusarium oxysporum]